MGKMTCLGFAAKYSGRAAGWPVGTSNEKILLVILPLNASRHVNWLYLHKEEMDLDGC